MKDEPAAPVAKEYNVFIGSVELAAQLRRSSSISWTDKWWKRIFFFVIDQAICNDYTLCRESRNHQRDVGKDKMQNSRLVKHLEFRKALAKQVIRVFSCRKRR